jgi:hypothetical protein
MLLLKDINEYMKEATLNITSKVGASFKEQVDDSILSRYLMIYINNYSSLFFLEIFAEFSVLLHLFVFLFILIVFSRFSIFGFSPLSMSHVY